MANYDFTYTGAEIQAILDTAKKLKDSGYIFLGVATPSTNPGTPTQKVYYEAKQAGTYTNFGGVVLPDGISLLIWNGSWTSETVMCGDGGVFDISVYKSSGGTLATFADLAAALDGGNNIPANARKGGMSVKFVQSSDNKYVQYFLIKNTWSATASDWQKTNLENEVNYLSQEIDEVVVDLLKNVTWNTGGYYNDNTGTVTPYSDCKYAEINISSWAGKFAKIKAGLNLSTTWTWVVCSDETVRNVADYQLYVNNNTVRLVKFPDNAQTLRISYNFRSFSVLLQGIRISSYIYNYLRNDVDIVNVLSEVFFTEGGYYDDTSGNITEYAQCSYAQFNIKKYADKFASIYTGNGANATFTWFVLSDNTVKNISDYQLYKNGNRIIVHIPENVTTVRFSYNRGNVSTPEFKIISLNEKLFQNRLYQNLNNILEDVNWITGGYYNDNTGEVTPYQDCKYASFNIEYLRGCLIRVRSGVNINVPWTWFVLSDNSIVDIKNYQLYVDNYYRIVRVPDTTVKINISYNFRAWGVGMTSKINEYEIIYPLINNIVNPLRTIKKTRVIVQNNNDYAIRNTLAGITDASYYNRYEVYIPNGNYFELDIVPKSYVDIIGESVEGVIITCDSSSSKNGPVGWKDRDTGTVFGQVPLNTVRPSEHPTAFHIFFMETAQDVTIANMTLNGVALKYCVHADYNVSYDVTIKNVRMRSDGCYRCVGCACGYNSASTRANAKKQFLRLINCSFNNIAGNLGGVSWQNAVGHHDFANNYNSLTIYMEGCLTNVGFIDAKSYGSLSQQIIKIVNCKTTSEDYSFKVWADSDDVRNSYIIYNENNVYDESTVSIIHRPDFQFGIGLY